MATIPLPALAAKAPQVENPLDVYSKFAQLKSLQNQQQIQQQQITAGGQENQMRANQLRDVEIVRQSYMDAAGDLDKTAMLAAQRGATPKTVFDLRNAGLDWKQKIATVTKEQAANQLTKVNLGEESAGRVLAAAPEDQPAVYATERKGLLDSGLYKPEEIPEQYPGPDFVKLHQVAANHLKQTLAQVAEAGSKAQTAGVEFEQKQRVLAGTNAQGETAEQQAQLAQGKQRIGIEGARLTEERRHNQATEGALSEDGLNVAADNYAKTGQMPTGMRSAAMVSKIITRAAERNPGGLDLAGNKAAYQANTDSLKGLQKNLDSVTAFENTANKNLDLFVSRAQKVVDSGSPWVNAPLRTVQMKALGDSDLAAFNAARQVAVNEIAKVTGNPGLSGQLSDSARHEVESFNPADATLKQTLEVAKVLKQDMQNRRESYQMQIGDIRKRISGSAAPAKGAPAGVWGNIPGAVQHP